MFFKVLCAFSVTVAVIAGHDHYKPADRRQGLRDYYTPGDDEFDYKDEHTGDHEMDYEYGDGEVLGGIYTHRQPDFPHKEVHKHDNDYHRFATNVKYSINHNVPHHHHH